MRHCCSHFLCVSARSWAGKATCPLLPPPDVQTAYENTNVLDNLEGSTIGGKEFDIADYPHSDSGVPQIISLVEFCYSYYADRQEDFGLYIYVYNPQDIAFDMATDRNKIQLTYGDKQSYSKYTLEFLNYSEQAGYEGRFYKFRIDLSDAERLDILNTVDDNGRVYKISGIELSYKGNVTEYVLRADLYIHGLCRRLRLGACHGRHACL